MTPTEEKSANVVLRVVLDADLPVFFEQEQDPEAIHMAAFTPKDPSDHAAFLAHWVKIRGDKGITIRTILHNGRVAGSVASYGPPNEHEVTYWLGREYWRKGIATAALKEFLRLVTIRPLFARAAKDNLASLRVLAKCGFKVSGEGRGFANARGKEIDEFVLKLE